MLDLIKSANLKSLELNFLFSDDICPFVDMNKRVVTLFVFQKVCQSNELILKFKPTFVLFSLLVKLALLILSDVLDSDVNTELDKDFIFNLFKSFII